MLQITLHVLSYFIYPRCHYYVSWQLIITPSVADCVFSWHSISNMAACLWYAVFFLISGSLAFPYPNYFTEEEITLTSSIWVDPPTGTCGAYQDEQYIDASEHQQRCYSPCVSDTYHKDLMSHQIIVNQKNFPLCQYGKQVPCYLSKTLNIDDPFTLSFWINGTFGAFTGWVEQRKWHHRNHAFMVL